MGYPYNTLIAHQATNWHNFSVMAKLPATSYVRMVDIWLIFVQLYPFIEANNINIVFLQKLLHLISRLFCTQ